MIRRPSYFTFAALFALPSPLRAQPGGDTVAVLTAAHARIVEAGPALGPATWPGFRPDTIPHLYVLPDRGAMLLGWDGALPEGWMRTAGGAAWMPDAERGAASTGIQFGGRGVAQIVVERMDADALAGVTAHEAFHVFQRASRVQGRRFGAGENSMLLSTYPAFDAENEALMALEGRLLRAALTAPDDAAAHAGREFLAVRAARQRRLGPEMAEFEAATELNEGLAEYALLRARSANPAPAALLSALDDVMGDGRRSLRLRFYATGSGMAYLLDRLGGAGWKQRMMDDGLTLRAALARAVGAAEADDAIAAAAGERMGLAELRGRAARMVAERRAARAARVDSVLAAPGVVLRIVADRLNRGLDYCGFDPQNLLMVGEDRFLHTRWLRACAPGLAEAEFNTPVVQDGVVLTAVAGPEVRLTVRGVAVELGAYDRLAGAEDLRIESAGVTMTAARADVEREGRMIVVHPLPPE
jgi:hypothetical protein